MNKSSALVMGSSRDAQQGASAAHALLLEGEAVVPGDLTPHLLGFGHSLMWRKEAVVVCLECVSGGSRAGENQPAGGRRGRGGRSDGFTSCWGEAEILNGSRRPLCKPFPTEKKVKAGLKVLPRNLAHRGAQSMDGNSLREGHFSLQANWVPESGCVGVWAIDTAHNH